MNDTVIVIYYAIFSILAFAAGVGVGYRAARIHYDFVINQMEYRMRCQEIMHELEKESIKNKREGWRGND